MIPTVEAFAHTTDYAYSKENIISYEKEVLRILNWKVNYQSMAFWANLVTKKWDDFSQNFIEKYSYDLTLYFKVNFKLPKFRSENKEEYLLFRYYFQIIDLITLDLNYLQFGDKSLCLTVMYLLLGLYLKIFDLTAVIKSFSSFNYMNEHLCEFNKVYNKFLNYYIGCEFDEISETISFASTFFCLNINYKLPIIQYDESEEVYKVVIIYIINF
jgi:hypothetical protein